MPDGWVTLDPATIRDHLLAAVLLLALLELPIAFLLRAGDEADERDR